MHFTAHNPANSLVHITDDCPMVVGVLLVIALVFGSRGAADEASAQDAAATTGIHKILFLGNSITLHGPAPSIGWSGNWGMAASAAAKDFVHLVTSHLAMTTKTAPEIMVKNIAEFERQYATYNADEKLKDAKAFGADLVIVAIGENVPKLDSEEAKVLFRDSLRKMLRGFKLDNDHAIIVRSCFWPSQAKDQILQQVCKEVGGIFVDISKLSEDESNYARSERKFMHAGVAAHPGDRGMQAIANAILAALRRESRTDVR